MHTAILILSIYQLVRIKFIDLTRSSHDERAFQDCDENFDGICLNYSGLAFQIQA